MPFYEYQCRACGAQAEVLQKITDAPLKKCPECGQNKLAKLVSAPVFRLKGGGWYETDFKSDKDRKRNLVDAEKGEAKPEAKAEGKSDDKPAGKSEAKAETKTQTRATPAAAPVSARPVKRPARKPAKAPARR
jgi:putative FmdB family regulatory protein